MKNKMTAAQHDEFARLLRAIWCNQFSYSSDPMPAFHAAVTAFRDAHNFTPYESYAEYIAAQGRPKPQAVTSVQQEQRQYLNQREKIRVQRNIHPRR